MRPPVSIPCMPDGRPAPWLMTREELAEFLRIDVKHVRHSIDRLRSMKGLEAVQIGQRVLYPLSSVLAFVEKQQKQAAR